MKNIVLFLALLAPVLVSSQTWDIVLDPIEQAPTAPTAYSLQASGNWGAEWTGSRRHYQDVYDRAQRPVVVFVFDTAPVLDHPALTGVAWNEYGKSYTGETEIRDGNGHGTHVAGIIGARSDQYELGIGRALADRELLRIIPIEVLNDAGSGSFSWTARAVLDAIPLAVHFQGLGYFVAFNFSLGGPGTHDDTARALEQAEAAGVFIAAAAGNTSREGIQFPGRSTAVQAIGSLDPTGGRSSFSTTGDSLFMAAPGRSILSTYKDGRIVELSGTSMATPTQVALAAIAASVHPKLNARQIRKLLIDTATDIDPTGRDKETGYGYNFVGKILAAVPDVPDEEPGELIEKKARTIEIDVPGTFEAMYQQGGGRFIPFQVTGLRIKIRTKLYAEDAARLVGAFVDQFFRNRALVLRRESDFLDAGHWAGRFLEIQGRDQGLKIRTTDLTVISQTGLAGKPKHPGLFDFFTPQRITSLRY